MLSKKSREFKSFRRAEIFLGSQSNYIEKKNAPGSDEYLQLHIFKNNQTAVSFHSISRLSKMKTSITRIFIITRVETHTLRYGKVKIYPWGYLQEWIEKKRNDFTHQSWGITKKHANLNLNHFDTQIFF